MNPFIVLRNRIMEMLRVSTKGQVVLPKRIRDNHHWQAGQELAIVDLPEGVLLRKAPAAEASWNEIVGILAKYRKETLVTDEDMHKAILAEVAASYQRSLDQ